VCLGTIEARRLAAFDLAEEGARALNLKAVRNPDPDAFQPTFVGEENASYGFRHRRILLPSRFIGCEPRATA
jgi:hypothetical protein